MIPAGIILIWYGTEGTIPAGYVKCDGNNGTPNLEDKFIVGAGNTYAKGDTGGNVTHTHDFTGDGHSHTVPAGIHIASGAGFDDTTNSIQVTGTTNTQNGLPPYHALFFIMKT